LSIKVRHVSRTNVQHKESKVSWFMADFSREMYRISA
jgi:hypothetical protein